MKITKMSFKVTLYPFRSHLEERKKSESNLNIDSFAGFVFKRALWDCRPTVIWDCYMTAVTDSFEFQTYRESQYNVRPE